MSSKDLRKFMNLMESGNPNSPWFKPEPDVKSQYDMTEIEDHVLQFVNSTFKSPSVPKSMGHSFEVGPGGELIADIIWKMIPNPEAPVDDIIRAFAAEMDPIQVEWNDVWTDGRRSYVWACGIDWDEVTDGGGLRD